MTQADLFGEPERDPKASQWFTPPWLAARLARWVAPHARVLEPACGSGNLLEALLRNGHDPMLLWGVELDERLYVHARKRLGNGVGLTLGDFESEEVRRICVMHAPEVALMNPPFEANAHMRFVQRALELAPEVVGIFPSSFEFGDERDRLLWATRGVVVRRARLPLRVDYGGDQSPSFDTVALKIRRRDALRRPDEQLQVFEEVWRP